MIKTYRREISKEQYIKAMRAIANGSPARCKGMDEAEKERLIKKNMLSIENRVRHVFNQGYEMGVKKNKSEIPTSCGDAISRQAVLDATVNKNSIWNMITNSKGENLEEIISQLPSVSPQQRTVKWKSMTEEELMKKIEKEEKWLIHALQDRTDMTSSYSVDIAFDAVKHYVKEYINSQQKEGSNDIL